MDDQQFRQLLDHFDCDWAGYRKVRKGVKKRVSRHMQQLGCRQMSDYLAVLDTDPSLSQECERRMTVAVSRFFRDRQLWERLGALLFEDDPLKRRAVIRIWSAGCAGGEEVYSLKILEAKRRQTGEPTPLLSILATDKNPENLQRAINARYPAGSLKELPPEAVSAFFASQRGGRRHAILPFLAENIEWRRHDLLEPPPEETFAAIFLRNNLLTYYSKTVRKKLLPPILGRLETGGILVVGSHERLPEGFGFMERDARCPHIYFRNPPAARPLSC